MQRPPLTRTLVVISLLMPGLLWAVGARAACFQADGICDANHGEECSSCPQDCGVCAVCGDGACEPTEDCWACPLDCGSCSVCGDGICMSPETCASCVGDCGACATCGDGVCEKLGGESCSTCAPDCGVCPTCGDDICDVRESCGSCPADCICSLSMERKPLVLILFDTSGSMEYTADYGASLPVCDDGALTQCEDTPGTRLFTRSRAIVGKEVLTGSFPEDSYRCCSIPRTSQEPDPDIPVHFEVPLDVAQLEDGIMDVYRQDVRFGLLTFDAEISPSVGNDGAYSYGPDLVTVANNGPKTWNWGAKNAQANRGYHAYNGTIIRATGALQAVPESEDPEVMAAQNDTMQDEVRWLFPYGRETPLAALVDDARYYVLNDENISGSPCDDQNPSAVILVTDGHPSFDECFASDPVAQWGEPSANTSYDLDHDGNPSFPADGDCNKWSYAGKAWRYPWWYYQTTENMTSKLFEETGFRTFVIGFMTSLASDTKLRLIAEAGRTCRDVTSPDCYQHADSYESLYLAYDRQISTMINMSGIRAKTTPATTQRTSFRATATGLYEVAARFELTNRMWHGKMERVTYACNDEGQLAPTGLVDFADTLAAMAPSQRRILTSTSDSRAGQTPTPLSEACDAITGCDDALVAFLTGESRPGQAPVLGDIRHASPVIAVGPELDRRGEDYRDFRRAWGGRDTMVYAGSNDGMLHAFVLADLDGDGDEGVETWAYIPRSVQPKLAALPYAHQNMVDATPAIADVRLYRDTSRTPTQRWATVLVGGLREGGHGFYALDITDPDDPRYLWEISAEACATTDASGCPDARIASLGESFGTPTLGTVAIERDGVVEETAVAVLPGGVATASGEGALILVVELETGAVLHVFDELASQAEMVPVTGSVSSIAMAATANLSRFFVGDEAGRLLRGDLTSTDPAQWRLEVFFDPVASGYLPAQPEPSLTPPAVARDRSSNLVIIYGTGDLRSLSPVNGRWNFVASLTERRVFAPDTLTPGFASEVNWVRAFHDGTKLTGAPVVFDRAAYFPTLQAPPPGQETCAAPFARLWGLHYTDVGDQGEVLAMADLNGDATEDLYTDYGPNTVMFGVDVAPRPECVERVERSDGTFALAAVGMTAPQLVAQTGAAPFAEGVEASPTSTTPSSSGERTHKVRIDLPMPATSLRALSWTLVYQ